MIGYDDQRDLALIQVNITTPTPFLPLTIGKPTLGEPALAIGNGNAGFLRSKTGRMLKLDVAAERADFPPDTLEMSVPVVPGDSGGPLLNKKGELMGIISYIRISGVAREIRSYAVPITRDSRLLADLRSGAKREAPMIGIVLSSSLQNTFAIDANMFKRLSRQMNLGGTPGAFFDSVYAGSPAAKAGLIPLTLDADQTRIQGDIVTEVNGKRIINFSEFQFAVRTYKPGDTISLTVIRDGKTIKVPVTLVGSSQVR